MVPVQGVMAQYELDLNPTKTHIVELPSTIEDPWVSELRVFKVRTSLGGQSYDVWRRHLRTGFAGAGRRE